jgi:hypothetical protein
MSVHRCITDDATKKNDKDIQWTDESCTILFFFVLEILIQQTYSLLTPSTILGIRQQKKTGGFNTIPPSPYNATKTTEE